MTILILNWRDIKNPKSGGAEIILYELSKRLIKKNHQLTWFCSSFEGAKEEENIDGIKIIRRGNELSVYWHAFQFYRNLDVKPDVVLDCVNTVCWQTPLYIDGKKKFLYANQSAREVFFYEYPFPLGSLAFVLEPIQYLTYKNTKVLCYSQSIKDDLISFGLSKNNISIFPLGIDHKRYKPGKKFSEPTFIFVARFVKNKRADICIKAMKIVARKFPKSKLYLVGYGDQESNLKDLIKRYNLIENVFIVNKDNVFLERNVRDVKIKLMQGAWALLLPSVKEGWGMVVTEAAACGTPSIVSNVTGLKDAVINNKTGLILSKNPNPTQLAQAMIKIAQDKEFLYELSDEALKFAKKFSWEKSFNEFYKILCR